MNNILIIEFLKSIKEKGTVSDISISMYKRDLLDFQIFVKDKDLRTITKEDIAKYITFMETKYKKNSIIRKTSSIKSFYKFLVKKEFISDSPANMINLSRKDNDIQEKKIEVNELKSILEICPENPKGRRDKVIILLLAETGLQITEILNLKISELEKKDYKSFIVKTTNEYIIVQLSKKVSSNLKKYIFQDRNKLIKEENEDKIFADLSRQNFKQRFVNYGKKASLTRHILPHMIKKRVEYERYEILTKNKTELFKKIREEYFRIGIGDN